MRYIYWALDTLHFINTASPTKEKGRGVTRLQNNEIAPCDYGFEAYKPPWIWSMVLNVLFSLF